LSPTPQMLALASASCSAVFPMLIQRGLRHSNFYFLRGEQLYGRIVVGTVFAVLGVFLRTGTAHLLVGG
jgi:hypothetical protein